MRRCIICDKIISEGSMCDYCLNEQTSGRLLSAIDNVSIPKTKKLKVYVSGQISGLDEKVARRLFGDAKHVIRYLGHEAIVPVVEGAGAVWSDVMKRDIKLLVDCDAIWMLNNYKDSKGALLELHIAKALGFVIING